MGASIECPTRSHRQRSAPPSRGSACVIAADEADRDGVAGLLQNMGFATRATANAAVGAEIAGQILLSVIVINVMTPDGRGLQWLRRIRATAPDALVIALTPAPRGLALVYAAGADIALASPACGEALCATINYELPPLDQGDASGHIDRRNGLAPCANLVFG